MEEIGQQGGQAAMDLHLVLEDSLREFVESEARTGGYTTAGDYVTALVREAQARREEQRAAEERLKELLREGIESGEATEMTAEDWAGIRREVTQRVANGPPE
jgi:antitoxin ParD1/3/4